ncbi:MAG TPA: hypothetical protein PLJ84_00140 [Bacteroidales bacterium]|nr:hypothetical protein [Bacteroidales bacterium]HPT00977.1 hypothetical protein [Bacteroidales bacterium]
MTTQPENEPICCPPFEPAPWDDKMIEWNNKLFLKSHVCTFFYMPLNFDKAMRRLDKLVKQESAAVQDYLCLSDHTSKWNMDVYLAVDKTVPGAENVTLSGKFYSKVYEGPFSDTGKWCKDYESIVKSKGMAVKKWYMWYTTCPKCAKKYGKNYTVIMGQVE